MKMLGDLIWRLAPLVAFLNAIAGWNGPLAIRRFGIPLAVVFFGWLYHRFAYKRSWIVYTVYFIGTVVVFSLPLTFAGDSIPGQWFNWVWVWILGWLQGLSLFPLIAIQDDWDKPTSCWVISLWLHAFIFGSLATLSNTWGYPVHAWFEILIGLSYGGFAAWIIGEKK